MSWTSDRKIEPLLTIGGHSVEAVAYVGLLMLTATLITTIGVLRRGRRRAESELAVTERHMRMAATAGV